MKTRSTYQLISLAFLMQMAPLLLWTQTDYSLHGFTAIPQSNYSNPANIPDSRLSIGVPFISSFSNSTFNSSFSFNDLFINREGSDSLYLNLSAIIQNAEENTGYLTEVVDHDLLFVGIKAGKGFLNFGVRNRLYIRSFYTKDLLDLLWNGNVDLSGKTYDLSKTSIRADHFISYYLSFAFPVSHSVNLGLRVNYNQGLSNISTERNQLSLKTTSDPSSVYAVAAETDFLVNTSQLASVTSDGGVSLSDYFLNFENRGFSFDLGASFKFSERVSMHLSALDLGYITWKSDLMSYESSQDSVYFDGIYADITDKDIDIFQMYGDSLSDLLKVSEYSSVYMTNFPVRIIGSLEYYSLDKADRLSVMFAGRFLKDYFEPSLSVGYDRTVSRHFAFKVSYTYLTYAPLNFGVGMVINAKPFQFYFLTDNVMAALNLSGQRYVHFRVGLNLIFPKKKKKKSDELPFGPL